MVKNLNAKHKKENLHFKKEKLVVEKHEVKKFVRQKIVKRQTI